VDLDGARAVVTGGASGIGAAVVSQLRRAGASVGVLDLAAPAPTQDLAVLCDVADEAQVVAGVRAVHDALGGVDLAVLSAGVGGFSSLLDMSADEWDRVLSVNLRGAFLCLREAARLMVEGGRGGAIVVVGSVSGFLVERLMGHYSVSKAAVHHLARVAARELGPFGIRVNAVAPGVTDTPLAQQAKLLPGYWERAGERAALGAVGSPDAVAEAVLALLRAEWVTGQVVAADGGVSLWSPIDPAEALGR